MSIGGRRARILLFSGDIVAFIFALYLTLALRYLTLPGIDLLSPYVVPFSPLFLFWALVFYSAGLYDKRILLFPSRLPDALLKVQFANILFAALFFFLVPTFGIAPKIILALYLVVSLVLVFVWRLSVFPRLLPARARERAVLIAEGLDAEELFEEVNGNPRYAIEFIARTAGTAAPLVVAEHERVTAAPASPSSRSTTLSFEDLYEEVFDRVPLSKLDPVWFRKNVIVPDPFWYGAIRRLLDLIGGVLMGLITLAAVPFVSIANLFEGPGPLFITQERFGKDGARIKVYKFRSMTKNLSASGEWVREGENRVTKVGAFLRQTSLDEFPQFVNVLTGDLSLIGPRSDIWGLGERLAEALPFYMERYRVTPGITGWAQINQQYEPGNVSPQSIEETKVRLAYDFYYLKHRSLGLDLIIALKTVKRMFFRVSSW